MSTHNLPVVLFWFYWHRTPMQCPLFSLIHSSQLRSGRREEQNFRSNWHLTPMQYDENYKDGLKIGFTLLSVCFCALLIFPGKVLGVWLGTSWNNKYRQWSGSKDNAITISFLFFCRDSWIQWRTKSVGINGGKTYTCQVWQWSQTLSS